MPLTSSDQTPFLLIDDSTEDYQALKRCFRQLGFSNPLWHCEEGHEAIQLLQKTQDGTTKTPPKLKPGCILLDLNMPQMDGREILRQIKSDPTLKLTPVVVFSSSNDKDDIRNCYRDGANAYMVKPSNYDDLLKSMESFRNYWTEVSISPYDNQAT